MSTRARALARDLALASVALWLPTCLFDGQETKGLPCESDEHCGIGLACENGVCGGSDPCVDGMPVCSGPTTLQHCVNGEPLDISCEQVCNDQGLGRALACEHSEQSGTDGCYCDQSSSFCDSEGTYECWSQDDGRVCQDGAWLNLDCDYVCELDGLGSATGCGPNMSGELVCFCSSPCEDGRRYCQDSGNMAYCDQGTWTTVACQDSACESGVSLGCGYLASIGDETCLCGV